MSDRINWQNPVPVEYADVYGDKRSEGLFIHDSNIPALRIQVNSPGETPKWETVILEGSYVLDIVDLDFADVDGDGKLDIFVRRWGINTRSVDGAIENVYQERTIFNPDIVAKVERELGIRTAKK